MEEFDPEVYEGYQFVHWTHPCLPGGRLGPARGVLTRLHPIKRLLKEFTLFPKLPLDLRVYIWRMTVNFERVVHVYEDIEEPDSDSDETDSDEDGDEDEDLFSNTSPEEVKNRGFWSNHGQKQLEAYGFTSSRPKPELPNDIQQTHTAKLLWETTRVGEFCSTGPMPVLLHVCRESRQLLQSYGYELTFSTRTAPARTWFNLQSDILHLREGSVPEYSSPILDGGMWNLGQFSRQDLDRVRKLSLSLNTFDYWYGGTVPVALHKAVQMCGNLKELLIVEIDLDRGEEHSRSAYWDAQGDEVVVDLSVEEFWGHRPGWTPGRWNDWDQYNPSRPFISDFDRLESSYADISKDIEGQFRHQPSFFPDRKEWSTPTVRFVMLAARHKVAKFMRSREAYGRYIDNMYWKKVAEGRKSYRPPSPLHLTQGMEAEHDLWRDYGGFSDPPGLDWYKQAREAIHSVRGWPSPFTMEWIEASEARLDMDSWPWAED